LSERKDVDGNVCASEADTSHPPAHEDLVGHDYARLTPDVVIQAVEAGGVSIEPALLALNSYENRVYQFRDTRGKRWVAKFYRPNRWTDAQILEEHAFSIELAEAEIPVIAPVTFGHQTLHEFENFRFALFENRGGREPNLDDDNVLLWLGRFLGRIHNVGAGRKFTTRPELTLQNFGHESQEFLLKSGFVPEYLREPYQTVTDQILRLCDALFASIDDMTTLRIHGDCHPSNVLWTDSGPHFVDLDDSRTGPAVQDLWMLITGAEQDWSRQRDALLDGYEEFRQFDYREWRLVEALRSMRMMHYSAWIGRRWNDPAFRHVFPWFAAGRYWEEQILALKEQLFQVDRALERLQAV